MMLTGGQIRAARALLRWEQKRLAETSGVSLETVKRLEKIDGPVGGLARTADAITNALAGAGIAFIGQGEASTSGGPGVRLKGGLTPSGPSPILDGTEEPAS